MASKPFPPLLLHLLLLLSISSPAAARNRHVITFRPPSSLRPSSLAWDPSAQHFLVSTPSSVLSVSDAGVVETLISLTPPSSAPTSLAVDSPRRRLLIATPSSISAYDLPSLRRLFLSPLPSPASALAVGPDGSAYVTSATSNLIWKVSIEGDPSVLSELSPAIHGGGLDGIAFIGNGYLLAVQKSTGKVYRVDAEDGRAREVMVAGDLKGGAAIAATREGSAVVAAEEAVWVVKTGDAWGEAGVYDKVGLEGSTGLAVAIREGKKGYVLMERGSLGKEEEGYFGIEETEWGRDREDGEMVWVFVLLGLGMAYLMFWRFQMGKLARELNKKRA
ncbi:hypothetical protein QJS04_geneDACA005395 [Acorus gramineus]|uniref:Uncharacterized protein n=1 Tax=Acorus gramineus TaxID=55184 RepID=A0AAV9AW32_ACOGR|nr:hypothetical protein QJS04_geneDACA005395 [Acorus gramineus]